MTGTSLRRSTVIALAACALLAVSLTATLLWQTLGSRRTMLDIAHVRLQQFAQTAADNSARTLEMADLAMAAASMLRHGGGADHHRTLRQISVFVPMADSIEVFDESGGLVAESRRQQPREQSVADQAFFARHRDDGLDFHIDAPLARTSSGPWFIPISRRLSSEDGAFRGVMRVLLSADQLADAFQSEDTADADRVLLVGTDGTIHADSAPRGQRLIGRRISDIHPRLDEGATLVATHRLSDFPFEAVALLDADTVLDPWWPQASAMIGGAVAVVAGTLIAAWVILSLERRRAAVHESLRLRERAIAAVGNGVIITDARAGDHPIVYANPAFETLTGYSVAEVLGHNPRFLHGSDAGQAPLQQIREALSKGHEASVVLRNYRKDGVPYWCELLVTPVRDDRGVITHHLGVQRDITERIDAEARLRQTNAELEASNAELERFAYVASHDLQEPLRTVASYVQLLDRRYRDQLDDEAREFIAFAVAGAKRMQELIIDLLEYSRLIRLNDTFTAVDLNQIYGEVLSDLHVAVQAAGAMIEAGPLPTVAGDKRMLTSLFENVLGNAIKYRSPERPPVIRIEAFEEDREWRVHVRDNGIGIAPEYHEKVFGLFQRLHPRDTYPGTGIGLAVCRRVAERHGGRIWIDSAEGQGTTVTIALPVREVGPA